MTTIIGNLVTLIGADPSGLKKGTKEAEKALDQSVNNMGKTLNTFKNTVIGAFSVVAVTAFTKSVITAGIQMDAMVKSMEAATGSAEAQKAAFSLLRSESERLGTYLPTQVKGFQQLAAATAGTVLQGQAAVDIFSSLSEASTALQLSSDETSGALRAITQIISKGKVQAEELRGQLGERLPGAFQLAASAMQMTTQELSKALEMGEVYANDFIPAFAKALRERYAGAWENSAQSVQASINRLNTAWFEFKNAIFAQGGINKFFSNVLQNLTMMLNFWRENFGAMKNFFVVGFVDVINYGWIQISADFDTMIALVAGSWKAGIKWMLELYSTFINGIASMTEGVPFLKTLTNNLKASAMVAQDAANGLKGIGEILEEQSRKRQESLGVHEEIINSMLAENLQYENLTASAQSFAEAVGTINEQKTASVELTKEQMKLAKEHAEQRGEQMQLYLERQSMVAGAILAADKKIADQQAATEAAKAKLQKQVANQAVQNSKFALQEFGKNNAAAFEAFKAISIAETVVNTAKAAMGAYSAMASIPYVGPVLGAAAAIAAVAAGAAQISKISSMSASGGGSASAGGISAGGGAVGTYAASPTTGLPDLVTGAAGGQGHQTIYDLRDIHVDSEERVAQIADKLRELNEEKDYVSTTTVRT